MVELDCQGAEQEVSLTRISVGRPLELDIKCTETGHCKRTFGIRHSMEFGIRPLEIDIITSARWQMKNSYY